MAQYNTRVYNTLPSRDRPARRCLLACASSLSTRIRCGLTCEVGLSTASVRTEGAPRCGGPCTGVGSHPCASARSSARAARGLLGRHPRNEGSPHAYGVRTLQLASLLEWPAS
eukprot:scaffold1903_cov396-Prasinococcus_capsulatus_cf.AAC.23